MVCFVFSTKLNQLVSSVVCKIDQISCIPLTIFNISEEILKEQN